MYAALKVSSVPKEYPGTHDSGINNFVFEYFYQGHIPIPSREGDLMVLKKNT